MLKGWMLWDVEQRCPYWAPQGVATVADDYPVEATLEDAQRELRALPKRFRNDAGIEAVEVDEVTGMITLTQWGDQCSRAKYYDWFGVDLPG